MDRGQGFAVHAQRQNGFLERLVQGQAVLEILLTHGWLIDSLGCQELGLGIDLQALVVKQSRQRHAAEAHVAHSATPPGATLGGHAPSKQGAAVARTLQHHLVLDLRQRTEQTGIKLDAAVDQP